MFTIGNKIEWKEDDGMADREKVIKGLECITGNLVLCKDCGYSDEYGNGRFGCKKDCARDALELLKEQQQKKAELLKQFDKEIEWAEQARIDSACEGENAWVEHYACQKRDYEHAKSIVENTL